MIGGDRAGGAIDAGIWVELVRRAVGIGEIEIILPAGWRGELSCTIAVVHVVTGDGHEIRECGRRAKAGGRQGNK